MKLAAALNNCKLILKIKVKSTIPILENNKRFNSSSCNSQLEVTTKIVWVTRVLIKVINEIVYFYLFLWHVPSQFSDFSFLFELLICFEFFFWYFYRSRTSKILSHSISGTTTAYWVAWLVIWSFKSLIYFCRNSFSSFIFLFLVWYSLFFFSQLVNWIDNSFSSFLYIFVRDFCKKIGLKPCTELFYQNL